MQGPWRPRPTRNTCDKARPMTLEKILLFGLGLAVIAAVTAVSSTTTDNRETGRDGYKTKVEILSDKAK